MRSARKDRTASWAVVEFRSIFPRCINADQLAQSWHASIITLHEARNDDPRVWQGDVWGHRGELCKRDWVRFHLSWKTGPQEVTQILVRALGARLTLLKTKSNQPNAGFFFLPSCHHLRDKDAVILSKAVFSCLMQARSSGREDMI